MANDLRLQAVLDIAGKAHDQIKGITQGSKKLTESLAQAQCANGMAAVAAANKQLDRTRPSTACK